MPRPVVLLALLAGFPCALRAAEPGAGAPVDEAALVDDSGFVEAVSRRRQRIETAPQAVAVISAADLVATPAWTIPDRLRYVPGVDVYQARHGQYDVGLNGWNGLLNNRMLVVLDGHEYRQEEFGAINWVGSVSQSDVRRIEVVKGPASVTYGANAFGGAVAIIEREPDQVHRAYGVGWLGVPGLGDADATVLGPLGQRFYYKVSGGGSRLDDLPDTPDSGFGSIDAARMGRTGERDLVTARARATLGMRLPYDHRIEATWRLVDQSTWELVDDFDVGSNATNTRTDDLVVALRGPVLDLSWRHHRADKAYQNQKAFYVPARDFAYVQSGFLDYEDTVRGQVNLDTGGNTLSLGGEWSHWRSSSNLWDGWYLLPSTWKTVSTVNAAGFVEDQLRLSPRLALTAGLRADHHSEVGLHWSPRLAVNWSPDREQFVLLSWSSGYRQPSPIESFLEEYYFTSSPSLDVERISTVQLSWRRKHRALDLDYGLEAFGSRANDLIMPLPLSGSAAGANYARWYATGPDITRQPGPFLAYQNLDSPVLSGGLEGQARGRLGSWPLWLWGNGTWQRFRFQDTLTFTSDGFTVPGAPPLFRFYNDLGREVGGPPEWKGNLGLDLQHSHLFGSLVGRVVSGRTALSIADSVLLDGGYVALKEIPAYAACDLTVGWNFVPGRASFLRLAALDLFGTGHYEVAEQPEWVQRRGYALEGPSRIGRSYALQGGFEF